MNPENSKEVHEALLKEFRFGCLHIWIPDYFNTRIEHCKYCLKIRKKKGKL